MQNFKSIQSRLLADLNTPIAVVGLGISGSSALRLLKKIGFPDEQLLTHDQKLPCSHRDENQLIALKPKTLVLSPGVPIASPLVQKLLAQGAKLTSEVDLANNFLDSEEIVAITGSVGKSTVTSVIGHGLTGTSIASFTGGNLGSPLADYAYEKITTGKTADWIVLELSSYQLENFESLRCKAAIIVSLTPNHLERYDSLASYYQTKMNLLLTVKDQGFKILNNAGLDLLQWKPKLGAEVVWTDHNDKSLSDFPFAKSQMVGSHNQDNLALAVKLGRLLKWPESYEKALLTFGGLSHRLQNLGEKNQVLFLNDSKATTVASVIQAVESVTSLAKTRRKSWLLLGGKDKNLPWAELKSVGPFAPIFFGQVGAKAKTDSGLNGPVYPNLKEAMTALFTELQPGDLVLLSPGGTSLDEFKSFEDRGNFFIDQIAKWTSSPHQPGQPG